MTVHSVGRRCVAMHVQDLENYNFQFILSDDV